MALKHRIEARLDELEMPKGRLAYEMEHANSWVTRLLAGDVRMTPRLVARLSAVLSVPPSFFAGE